MYLHSELAYFLNFTPIFVN